MTSIPSNVEQQDPIRPNDQDAIGLLTVVPETPRGEDQETSAELGRLTDPIDVLRPDQEYSINFDSESLLRGVIRLYCDEQLVTKSLKEENTRLKHELDEAKYEANHDELTGLLNRRAFEKEVDSLIKNKEDFSIVFVDLNNFGAINKGIGHQEGDRFLKNFSKFLKSVGTVTRARHSDSDDNTVAPDNSHRAIRHGGDEFAVIVTNKDTIANIDVVFTEAITEQVKHMREDPEYIKYIERHKEKHSDKQILEFGASFGTEHWQLGMTKEDLLRSADTAMSNQKKATKARELKEHKTKVDTKRQSL